MKKDKGTQFNGLRKRYSAGFTIIEMVAVVTIIGFLLLIVISDFPKIKLQLAHTRVVFSFDQDVRKAQNLASSAVQYKDQSGTVQPVNGYGIFLHLGTLGNKTYNLYADVPSGTTTLHGIEYPVSNQQYDESDYAVETVDFTSTEPGIIIKEIKTYHDSATKPTSQKTVSINFNSLDLGTKIISKEQEQYAVDIVFSLESDNSITKTVSINQAGLITVK